MMTAFKLNCGDPNLKSSQFNLHVNLHFNLQSEI